MQGAQERQLAKQRFLAVEPALFWHIANAAAVIVINGGAIEINFAGVFREHAQCDAHGGGLARPIGTDEAEDFALLHAKGHIPQRADAAERFIEMVDF